MIFITLKEYEALYDIVSSSKLKIKHIS